MEENKEEIVQEVKPTEVVPTEVQTVDVDQIVGKPVESNNNNMNNKNSRRSPRELVLIVIAALTMIASGVYFAFFNEDDEEATGNNKAETVEKEDEKETTDDETKKEENNNTQSNEINDKDRFRLIQDKSTIKYYKENIVDKTMSNSDCGGILKFSLKTENGKIIAIDSNTGQTAEFTKIQNPKAMTIIPEGFACDLNIYVILTDSGDIYYENVDIQHVKNVKDLENDFKLLKTDYKFSDISIIYESEGNGSHYVLCSNTKNNELVRIELYDQFLKASKN